jgi:hypothetical protein
MANQPDSHRTHPNWGPQIDEDIEEVLKNDSPPDGVPIHELLTNQGWMQLCEQLQNGNRSDVFQRIYRDGRKSKRVRNTLKATPYMNIASWAWDCLRGQATVDTSIGFYSQDAKGMTCWGGADFDAHDPNESKRRKEIAELFRSAVRTFGALAAAFPEALVIFEASGQGFHLFLIRMERVAVSEMHDAIRDVVRKGGGNGVEVVPSSRVCKVGKALRAPGTWNPAVDANSMILGVAWPSEVDGQLDQSWWLAGTSPKLPERDFVLSVLFRATNDQSGQKDRRSKPYRESRPVRTPTEIWNDEGADFAIERPRTRYQKMLRLVGEKFYQYSRAVVMEFVRLQFECKTVPTDANWEEHLADADRAFSGMVAQWHERVPHEIRQFHDRQRTPVRRAAVRILENFGKYADAMEFPCSQRTLAERLGITKQAASKILKDWDGIFVKCTRPETVDRARRYVCLLLL